MSYYPDGMRLGDLPGFYDETRTITFNCGESNDSDADVECWNEWSEDVDVDARGGHDVEATCPECGRTASAYIQTQREWEDEMRAYYAD